MSEKNENITIKNILCMHNLVVEIQRYRFNICAIFHLFEAEISSNDENIYICDPN